MKQAVVIAASLSVLFGLLGCSVSDRTLNDMERRITTLKNKGVPDSALSSASVQLYQAKEAKKRGDVGLSKKSADSATFLIARAEAGYEQTAIQLKPRIDSLSRIIISAKNQFTGIPRRRLDSLSAKVDSFQTMNWVLQAEQHARQAVDMIPQLRFNQQRADELRPRIPGQWVCTQVTKSSLHKEVNAVEEKIFEFFRDGKAKLTEKKKGQSGTHLKEDWEFVSHGTYELSGDTINILVNRFASVKQNFMEKFSENGKDVWKPKTMETYDSLITDGSQDRFITFSDLKVDFKQAKTF